MNSRNYKQFLLIKRAAIAFFLTALVPGAGGLVRAQQPAGQPVDNPPPRQDGVEWQTSPVVAQAVAAAAEGAGSGLAAALALPEVQAALTALNVTSAERAQIADLAAALQQFNHREVRERVALDLLDRYLPSTADSYQDRVSIISLVQTPDLVLRSRDAATRNRALLAIVRLSRSIAADNALRSRLGVLSVRVLRRLGQELTLGRILSDARAQVAVRVRELEDAGRGWNASVEAAAEVFNTLKPRLRALGLTEAELTTLQRGAEDFLAGISAELPQLSVAIALPTNTASSARGVRSEDCDKDWLTEFSSASVYTRQRCTELGTWRRTYYQRCGGNPRLDIHGSRRASRPVYNARRAALYCAYYFGSPSHNTNQVPTAADFNRLASRIPYAFGGRIPVATGDRGSTYLNTFEVQQRRREARPGVRGAPAAVPAAAPAVAPAAASSEPVQPAR